jgi:prevent-host-death family protein
MKVINIRDLQKRLKEAVDAAQSEGVVVTRHGRPTAVLVGVQGLDWESVMRQMDPEFWQMIEERRHQGSSSPLEEVRKRLDSAD